MAPRPTMYQTEAGVSEHPWINKPDTKYKAEGVFKNTVVFDLGLPTTANLIALIEDHGKEAFERQTKGISAVELRKWKLYLPFEREVDENGEETGRVKVLFKRNHKIKLQGGEERELYVTVYDTAGNALPQDDLPAIYGGTVLQTLFSIRDVKVPGTKQAGVKLDMAAVKIIKLQQGGGRKDPFTKDPNEPPDDDGYVWTPGTKRTSPQESPSEGGTEDNSPEREF